METTAALPNWVIYAAVGGFLGAVGALLAWILEAAGQKWTRLLPVVAIACTGPVTRELVMPSIKSAGFESQLAQYQWIATLKEEMPDEYERIIAELKEAEASSTFAADAESRGFEAMANFRKRYAANLASADDQSLTEYMKGYLVIISAVRDKDGIAVCAEFAMKGPTALTANQRAYASIIESNTSLLIQTIASSVRNPQSVEPATDTDWEAVVTRFLDSDGTAEELQVVMDQNASSPSYCQAIIRFFQAIVETPAPSGHRIRAEMAKEMARS